MRYVFYLILLSVFCALTYSCTSKQTSIPTNIQKGEGEIYSNDRELRNGRMLARTKCAECHRFYSPEEWKIIIRRKSQRLSLRSDQVTVLDAYFQSESSTVKK